MNASVIVINARQKELAHLHVQFFPQMKLYASQLNFNNHNYLIISESHYDTHWFNIRLLESTNR